MAISALVTLMGVWFAAMASPGPDVVQIIRLGARSTRAAVWAALGSTTGLTIWTVASLAGLSALISAHPGILVAMSVTWFSTFALIVRAASRWIAHHSAAIDIVSGLIFAVLGLVMAVEGALELLG